MSTLLPLRDQLKKLESLQELDLKIDQLKKRKAAIPAVLKGSEDVYQKALAAVNERKVALGELEKVERQTKAAVELNTERLTRANSKLGASSNSQEYNAANREIDQLSKMNASLDEQIKKSKTDAEGIQKQLEALQASLTTAEADRNAKKADSDEKTGVLDGEIAELTSQRKEFLGGVDPRTLAQYDRVRVARAGLGIVPAVAGRCRGCNMMVPAQLYNEIQKANSLHQCPSCHRILFVPTASGPEVMGSALAGAAT